MNGTRTSYDAEIFGVRTDDRAPFMPPPRDEGSTRFFT
jgi:hypothetical protein